MKKKNNSIGNLIDTFYMIRQSKREKEEEIKQINKELDELEEKIISFMQIENLEKASGILATATYKVDIYASVENKEELIRWCVDNNRFDFLQSRVNNAPVKEMLETSNVTPPGVSIFNKTKLSIVKR